MEHEVEMCELLRRSPHRNLAVYYGYVVEGDRVQGLFFKRYQSTLLETVNPKRLSKRDFLETERDLVQHQMQRWIQQLRSAVSHIHALGYVHDDISPANIMLNENATPVLIDFGSLCRVGESLQTVRRTVGWHDESVSLAEERNDLDALNDIETWLFRRFHDLKFPG
ncbi:hypothetical protein NLG97_g10944 [Lecanicillium saksenae]|uniref:Uncharacterized protein n=1 Tax=Lecanicillium saksenae TaxID=468837 RepID=A0ACC1QBZ4_9HYPO|nr:hypothetical protein NLG97_g10944 [Lecanicillium saksenae]